MERNELAVKLEIIGEIFEDERIPTLLNKFQKGQSVVQFNAIIIQIESVLIKDKKPTADKLVMAYKGISAEEVDEMEDKEYAKELKDAITTDVMGFFV